MSIAAEGQLTRLSVTDASAFLYREAQFLDEQRFDEWLELFAPDGMYWIPSDPNDDAAAPRSVSIIYDDTAKRAFRIKQLMTGMRWAQEPLSQTRHMITNVQVAEEGDQGSVRVHSNFVLYERRVTGSRSFPGYCEHVLREEPDGWRIALKKVVLLGSSAEYFENLTFVV